MSPKALGEIPLLRPHGVNKRLSYDLETDGPFEARIAPGRKITARNSGEYIVLNGVLKPNQERSVGGRKTALIK